MNDLTILKKLFLFELEVALLSFIIPILIGYNNVTKIGIPFFASRISTCGPTWYMVIFGLVAGLLGFAMYYFFFFKLLKTPKSAVLFTFHFLALLSATFSLAYVLCGFA